MEFIQIDQALWNRSELFDRFASESPCTYSMTVQLDITRLLAETRTGGVKLFPTLLHGLSRTVNAHPEFRMALDVDGAVGYYRQCDPSYTVFHRETERFTTVWTAYHADFTRFYQDYLEDTARYGAPDCTTSKPAGDQNCFDVSCIPWTSFTGFNLNLRNGYDYFLPIFTIGKYMAQGEQILLPLAVQVHHAVCDGFHLARFVQELQTWADTFSL